ncbi:MAG: hypothetical protein NTX04_11165, partial [Verrucomicrobia bacterium]|nr:hypothetical protein [Verrucomicrobiota bacterium]
MIPNPLLRLCFIFLTSTLTWLPSTASAERRKEPLPEAPPAPLPFKAQVDRGDSIELQLRIYGRKNQPLKYLIKSPPKFGTLTPPKPLSDEISSVTYTPPTDLAISQDRFFYS